MEKRGQPEKASQPVAFITGTSSGFGLKVAVALAREGYTVAAAMRNLDSRGELLKEAEEKAVSERIHCYRLDVTDTAGIAPLVKEVEESHGPIEVLVNNAGYAAGGSIEDIPMEEWRAQFETNVFGLMAVTKEVIPLMRIRRRGKIINISSVSGRIGFPGYGPYAASKFAVEGFSESLRLELLPYGVHVVLIEPGAYKTAVWKKGFDRIFTGKESPYYPMMQSILDYSRRTSDNAPPPSEVAEAICRVAAVPSPRLRYPLGRSSRTLLFLKQGLPWKWFERAVHWLMK